MDNPDKLQTNPIAESQVFAAKVNLLVGYELVKVMPNPNLAGGPLTFAELTAFAEAHPGWYELRTAFLNIRQINPAKSEVIRTGKQMSAYGWKREKRGPWTFWHLDNASRQRAD